MAANKRKSTVHDLASLRIHPDGSRVGTSSTNSRLRNAKYVVQDPRGNWIARDAGGLGQIKQRYSDKTCPPGSSAKSDAGSQGGEKRDVKTGPEPLMDKRKARVMDDEDHRAHVERDPRAVRRKLFVDDFGFLSRTPGSSATSVDHVADNYTEKTKIADPTSVSFLG